MDELDEIIGEEETLLVNATTLDIYSVFSIAAENSGIAVPAHIDRTSYSVLSNLGFIPPDLNVPAVEITKQNLEKMKSDYQTFKILTNSDAHYLENISEQENHINKFSKTTKDVLDFLCKKE